MSLTIEQYTEILKNKNLDDDQRKYFTLRLERKSSASAFLSTHQNNNSSRTSHKTDKRRTPSSQGESPRA